MSEDIEAVFDQDRSHPSGPHCNTLFDQKRTEEMLGSIVSGLTAKVLEHFYGGNESKIPAVDYLGVKPAPAPSLPSAPVLSLN